MKKLLTLAVTVFLSALLVGCSNVLTNIYNNDNSQKTGNDSILSPSSSDTSSILTEGLVVIKATAPSANQIADFDPDTEEYTIANSFVSADDSVEFRCFTQDKWANVTWKAEQISSTEQATSEAGATYTECTPKTVSISPKSDTTYASAILPYGKTKVTATITADDPHYSRQYSVTISKPFVYDADAGTGTIAQIRNLSFTALPLSADELPDGMEAEPEVYQDIVFDPKTDDYTADSKLYWVNEDVGDIQINLDIPSGVTLVSIEYAPGAEEDIHKSLADGTIRTVKTEKTYVFESAGGNRPLCITTKDSAQIERTYKINIKKPQSSDTSLRKFGYKITGESITGTIEKTNAGLKTLSGSPIGTSVVDSDDAPNDIKYGDWGTYYKLLSASDRAVTPEKDYGSVQLSADYVRDITQLTYYIVPFHKRATVTWTTTSSDSAPTPSSGWQAYDKTAGMQVDFNAEDTDSTELVKKLWIKVTAEDGTTIKYYTLTAKKPDAGNTVIETVYITAKETKTNTTKQTLEKGKSNAFADAANLDSNARLLNNDDTNINVYTDKLTFYVRTANKHAAVTYELTEPGGTKTTGTTTEETYEDNSAFDEKTYKAFTLTGLTDDKYIGNSTITLYVNGTPTVFTLSKPDSTNTELDSLKLQSQTDVNSSSLNLNNALKVSLKSTDNTKTIGFKAVTKSKTATITVSAASTEVANNYPTGAIPVTATRDSTYPTDWVITLGDATTMIPEGTTVLTITVSNTSPSAVDKVYTVTVTKDCDSESRLESLTVSRATKWETITNLNTLAGRTEQVFDEDIYRNIAKVSGASVTWPDSGNFNYLVTTTDSLPTITATALNSSSTVKLQIWEDGSGFVTKKTGTGSITFTADVNGSLSSGEFFSNSIAYTISIVSKDNTLERKYIFRLLYAGTELATLDDAGETTPGTYEYESDNITGDYATGWSIDLTTFSSDQNITATGEDADGNEITCTATRDTTDLTKWKINGSTGFTIGINKVYITVTNSNGTGSSIYTYNIKRTE